MIKLLAIPVAGTVAALIAILLAHPPRDYHDENVDEGPGPAETRPDPADLPDLSDLDLPIPDEDRPAPKPPPPDPIEVELRLEANGKLVVLPTDMNRTFDDIDALVKELGADPRVRHRVVLSNGEGTDEAALDTALEKLRATFDVRKFYSPPKDGE